MQPIAPVFAESIGIDEADAGEAFGRVLATAQRSNAKEIIVVTRRVVDEDALRSIAQLHMAGKRIILAHNRLGANVNTSWLTSPIP